MNSYVRNGTDVVSSTGHLAVMSRSDVEAPVPDPLLARATVVSHGHVADRYWHLRLAAPQIAAAAQPGQFVMLTIARETEVGPVLPRPMAIYGVDVDAGIVDVMYGVVGAGTRRLTTFRRGEVLLTVGPLGRGFVMRQSTERILLIGRGIGTCSLTSLAFEARARGIDTVAVDSARNAHSLIADRAYRAAAVRRVIQVTDADATSDPQRLRKVLTQECGPRPPQQIFVCGSNRLIRLSTELGDLWGAEVQASLEAHMACGLGYCHGCSSGQRTGESEAPLICRDGPVFKWTSGPGVQA